MAIASPLAYIAIKLPAANRVICQGSLGQWGTNLRDREPKNTATAAAYFW